MRRYLESHVTEDLNRKMVFIGGPRQVGKTTLSRNIAPDGHRYLNWDDLELEFRGSKFSLNHSVTKESSCSSLIVTASSCRLTTKNSAITASIACMIWSAWLPSELRNCSTVP